MVKARRRKKEGGRAMIGVEKVGQNGRRLWGRCSIIELKTIIMMRKR